MIKEGLTNWKIVGLVLIHRFGMCKFLHKKGDWQKDAYCWQSYCPILDRIKMAMYPFVEIKKKK